MNLINLEALRELIQKEDRPNFYVKTLVEEDLKETLRVLEETGQIKSEKRSKAGQRGKPMAWWVAEKPEGRFNPNQPQVVFHL